MALGLFKKNNFADIIFTGGTIYTQDPNFPIATAIAVKNGTIIDVCNKEDISTLQDRNTEFFDLEGRFLIPGLIEANDSPILDAIDEDVCLVITPYSDKDEIINKVSSYLDEFSDLESYFGYGYDSSITENLSQKESAKELDSVSKEYPIILLSNDSSSLWINTVALDIVGNAANEDEIESISLSYMLSVLTPIEEKALTESTTTVIDALACEGYTSVFSNNVPDYLTDLYQDVNLALMSENLPKQRLYTSMHISNTISLEYIAYKLQQNKTTCIELNGLMDTSLLTVTLTENNIDQKYLESAMNVAAERGFGIMLRAEDTKSLDMARNTLASFRQHYKRTFISICHGEINRPTVTELCEEFPLYSDHSGARAEIDERTIIAADKLGLSHLIGSIKPGKLADFAIFDEDPFKFTPKKNVILPEAIFTVINGNIVYDAENEEALEWYKLMSSQQF